MENPALYFENNVSAGLTLLEGMRACGIRRIVFSSSAATYGQPASTPIREDDPVRPVNPYGETKGMFEAALRWYHEAYGLQYVSLRYFNAAGATPEVGEDHDPETHLIPLVLRVALGQATAITIYGDDYPSTPDGTCVRDFVHVKDIARAHTVALATLERCSGTFNLGTGEGCSVQQVIDMAQNVTGHRIPAESGPRRAGDPEVLVACADRAEKDLGWKPEMSDLETILEDAWTWHRAHPEGYGHD